VKKKIKNKFAFAGEGDAARSLKIKVERLPDRAAEAARMPPVASPGGHHSS
jgi:hypothetical protein